jgi:N-acetylneuraminate synthase
MLSFEIGCNHKGDIAIAKELIHIAKIFLQCRCSKISKGITESCLQRTYDAPSNVDNSYGHTYGAHQVLEFDVQQHAELKPTARSVVYSTSVWDAT